MNLRTAATSISGTGTLGAKKGSMQVALDTTNLSEFQPVIQTLSGPQGLPIEVHGRASFKGGVSGAIDEPNVDGYLTIGNFDSLITPAEGTASGHTRRLHWDAFTGDVQYSSAQLVVRNARLKHDRSEVNFSVRAELQNGRLTDNSPFVAKVVSRGASVPDLAVLAGVTVPLTGAADMNVSLAGTQVNPQASGHVRIVNGTLYGETFKSLSSDVRLANRKAWFTNLELLHNGGSIAGTAAYGLDAKSAGFNLHGKNLELASLSPFKSGRVRVAGALEFTAEGGGTLDHPFVTGNAVVHNLTLNGERAGDLTLKAVSTGDVLTVTARSDFEHAALNVDGTIRLSSPFPADLAVRFDHLDIDALLSEYARSRLTGHSTIAGGFTVRGPLRTPEQLQIDGAINQVQLEVASIQVRNEGPIRFAMANDIVRLEQAHLVGGDTDMMGTGVVELAGAGKVDIRANGHMNMKMLQSFDPDVSSYGRLDMNLTIRGALDKPVLDGQIRVTNVGIAYLDLPNGLSDLNGDLVFNEDRLQVQHLTGRTGGGDVTIGGFVTFGRTVTFNMDAHARDVRLRYPQGVSSMADADLRLTGTLMNSLLSGEVTVKRFSLEPSFDLASFAAATKLPPTLPNPDSPMTNMRVDLRVVSTPELQVQTSLARISGDADLRLRGTVAKPIVLGRITIIEGQVMFNGTKYELDRGEITFTNPARIDPVLDMQLRTRVRDYDINIGLHGAVSRGIATTYRSDPPLPTSDVIALLAFGRTREENAQLAATNESFTQTASNAILGEALNATVSSRVQKLFGVSRIKINPEVAGTENNPGTARLTIEQQVANNVTITYITDVTRANQQIIQMEYNLSRSVSVIAVRDQNGVVGIDVRVRQRKR
jgi:translocation and assembly module TamB